MVHLLRIELHARPTIQAYAFLGEERRFEYGSNYEKLSIAFLQDEEGYYAALTRIEPTIQGGRLLQTREVTETFRLDHGKPVEAKWQYAGGGIGYGYIDLSATLSHISEKDPEIKKKLKGDDHFFLADFYQAKAEDERALGNAEVQRRIAYNRSHPNYSGMDPDVKKDYIIGEDKKDQTETKLDPVIRTVQKKHPTIKRPELNAEHIWQEIQRHRSEGSEKLDMGELEAISGGTNCN